MNSTPLLYFLLALSSLTFAIFHSRAVSTGEARNLSWNADKAGEAPPEHLTRMEYLRPVRDFQQHRMVISRMSQYEESTPNPMLYFSSF